MIIAALILLGIAAFLILAQARASRARKTRARATDAEKVPEFYEAIRPMVTQFSLLTRLIPLPGIRERYAHQLERAGLPFEMSADEFLALKLLILLIATTFAILVYSVLIPNWAVVLVLVAFGFFLPDLRLYDMVKTQERAYLRGLPGFLDLLALAVEAGLGFDAAVRKLTEILEPSPLTRGFQAFLRNMNVGLTRAEALREMARKLDLPDFDSFAHAVIQATESGASMGPVLRIQSSEMLFRRFERAERRAHELPIKLLVPLFFFIFPATFLMIIGPIYFQFRASGVMGGL